MTRRQRLEQMLKENPDDPFLLYGLAMDQQSAGEDEAAVAGFDRVHAVDPSYVAAYFQKAQILARLSRTDDARDTLRAGIAAARATGDDHAIAEMSEFLNSL
jgi:tetratricopeptide (TPR) repeat protein